MAASTAFVALISRAGIISLFICLYQNEATLTNKRSSWKNTNTHIVVINNSSQYYLGKIFQDYASNITGNISEERFHDLLNVLHIGEVQKLPDEQTGKYKTRKHLMAATQSSLDRKLFSDEQDGHHATENKVGGQCDLSDYIFLKQFILFKKTSTLM